MSHPVDTTITFRDPQRLYEVVAKCFERQAMCCLAQGSNRTLTIKVDNDNLQPLIDDVKVIDALPDEHAA